MESFSERASAARCWPRYSTDRTELQNWLAQTRVRISRLRAAIRAKALDADVGKLYDDCLALLDTYETYLANLGAIDRIATRQAQQDAEKVGWAALDAGWQAGENAKKRGASNGQAAGVGGLAGIVKGWEESDRLKHERNEARRAALEAEARKVGAAFTDTKSNAEVIAERLAKKHGWDAGEAGFDGFTSRQMGDYLKRRPRDPFVKVSNALIRVKGETSAQVMSDARSCLDAARLVPEGRVYDGYRAEFVAAAADLAATAAGAQLNHFAYSSGPAKLAPEAVRFCKTLLSIDSSDSSGTGNMLLARALGCAGRYADAIDAANTAMKNSRRWQEDGYFCYRYARLMSLTSRADQAGEWLEKAYRNRFSDVVFVRADPDLANFRKGKPECFKKLTTVNTSSGIDFGVLTDDVYMYNMSEFDLTNMRIEVIVKKAREPGRLISS